MLKKQKGTAAYKFVVLAGVVIIAVVLVFILSAGAVTEVETFAAAKGEMSEYIEETGEVKCSEARTIYSEISGIVKTVNIETGDSVQENSILLVIDGKDLELQSKKLEAVISEARAQVSGTGLENYFNKIEIAGAELKKAEIAYNSAERQYKKALELYGNNSVSKDELENLNDVYITAGQNLKSARYSLDELKKGAPKYVKDSYAAKLDQTLAEKDILASELAKLNVPAPINGMIMESYVKESDFIAPGTPLFKVGNINNIKITADILADDAFKIKIGNEVQITGESIGNRLVKGNVTKIAPAAKTVFSDMGVKQKRVTVDIEILESSKLFKPGIDVEIKIITAKDNDSIRIPESAVFEYEKNDSVFIVNEDNKLELHRIKTGISNVNYIEVTDGLNEGDNVVVRPENSLKEGMKVK